MKSIGLHEIMVIYTSGVLLECRIATGDLVGLFVEFMVHFLTTVYNDIDVTGSMYTLHMSSLYCYG